jgi:hypothetical protein
MLSPSQSRWNAGSRNGAPPAVVPSLFTFMYLRTSNRRRFPLQFDLIVINGGTDEISQSTLINLIALEKIARSPRVASDIHAMINGWHAMLSGSGRNWDIVITSNRHSTPCPSPCHGLYLGDLCMGSRPTCPT